MYVCSVQCRAVQRDGKTGELVVLLKRCSDFSMFSALFTRLIYMMHVRMVSAIYIQPKCNYLIDLGGYQSFKTEQFYKILKSLSRWHVAKCIPALKWLCFEFIN